MSNPRVSAIICGLVGLWLGYQIFFSAEAPSQLLAIMQWLFFFFAIAGCAAAVVRIVRERS
jgi:membrane protein DedA with SNARE-associated domain